MPTTRKSARYQFRLTTAGGFVLWKRGADEADVWRPAGLGEKSVALLAFLACHNGPVPRDVLTELLWEGIDRGRARNSLRQALFRIRSVIGADAVVDELGGLRLEHPLETDLQQPRNDVGGRSGGRRRFGRPSAITGRAFESWCEQMRAAGAALESERGQGAQEIKRWLGELWQRARAGSPVSAWLPHALDPSSRELLADVASGCRKDGGRVAQVVSRGPWYQPYALERDLAGVLWEMPGAAGVRPEHREAMERLAAGQRAQPLLLRTAILDLISAVAEDAPIMVQLEEPERYSTEALRELVGELSVQPTCPVLLVLAARDGAAPTSGLCLQPPDAPAH